MTKTTSLTKAPGAARIKAAFKEAEHAASNAVQKAMICGQLLTEQRAAMMTCHGGKSWNDKTKSKGDQFTQWLADHCPEIGERTAYRWMELSSRVASTLELPPALSVGNSVEGIEHLSLSHILTMPEDELPESARETRQLVFDFMAGKTMKECLAGVVVEGDEPHRITRAHNGANAKQTKGAARKDYPLFTAVKLKDISAHLGGWERKSETARAELCAVIRAAIIGDTLKLSGRGGVFNFGVWPEEFCKVAIEALRERLKGTK